MVCSLRLRQLASAVLVVGVFLSLAAEPASASTAQLIDVPYVAPTCGKYFPEEDCSPRPIPLLAYRARRGEANRVRIVVREGKVRIRDLAATIRPGRGCSRVGRHRVSCEMPDENTGIYVATGGRGDRVKVTLGEGPRVIVDGGSGDDVVVGGPQQDQLFGGRGEDVLRGRAGRDTLYDAAPPRMLRAGDPSPFESNRVANALPLVSPGRGRDAFDGGSGDDTVSYEGRSAKLRIDLASRKRVAGGRGEHDSISRAENAIGGAGGDRLAGTQAGNVLDGRDGNDRIVARGGDDSIEGGGGRNVISAGPGNDSIDSTYRAIDFGPEEIFCGSGSDYVGWIFPSDFVEDDCERVELNFLADGTMFGGTFRLLPLREGSPPNVLSTTLTCFFRDRPAGCQGKLELAVAGPATREGTAPPPGTLLGSESYTLSPVANVLVNRAVTFGLSPAGVETLRQHRALRVNVKATENSVPTKGFQTVLRSP